MWRHCVEFLALFLMSAFSGAALVIAITAMVKAYGAAEPLREGAKLAQQGDKSQHTEEYKKLLAEHWKAWRCKMAGYGSDIDNIVNPLRRDNIDNVKESANWGRLGIQYAIIGNGGALVAALPYLLSNAGAAHLPLPDATWCAWWFVLGLLSAEFTCFVAYGDFQVTVATYWNDIDAEYASARQRHFEINDKIPVEPRLMMRNTLRSMNARTGLCGVALAVIAWLALAVGAIRVVSSVVPTT